MLLKRIGHIAVALFKATFIILALIYFVWQLATLFLPFDKVVNFTSQITGIEVSQLTLPVSSDPTQQRPIDSIYLSSYAFFFGFSLIAAIVGTIVLSRGRSVFDALGIFAVFAIPRKRDYTASVLDSATYRPIAFATIYLVSKENGEEKVLLDTISDLNGQYKIYLKESKANLFLRAKVSGYETYEKPIGNLYQNNVLQDILMVGTKAVSENKFRDYYYSIRPKLFKGSIYFLYSMTVLYVVFNFTGFLIYGNSFTLFFLTGIYVAALIYNTFILFEIREFKPGKVLDFASGAIIQSAIVEIFDNTKQLQSISTPEDGIIRVELPEGVYKIQADKSSYEMVSKDGNSINFDEMLINKEGYLARNIYLKQTGTLQNLETSKGLLNPFA